MSHGAGVVGRGSSMSHGATGYGGFGGGGWDAGTSSAPTAAAEEEDYDVEDDDEDDNDGQHTVIIQTRVFIGFSFTLMSFCYMH